MINILLLMVDKAQTSPALSQVLPLVWNKIDIRGPVGLWIWINGNVTILNILHLSHKTFWCLIVSFLPKKPSWHSCRSCMHWLGQAPGAGSGWHLGTALLCDWAQVPQSPGSGCWLICWEWSWVLCSVTFNVGQLICMYGATQMTNSFQKACVRGNGWSADPESGPRGWLNRNCKTSWSLNWVNGSDVTGIHLCQGFSPRPAVFPRWLSLPSGDTSTLAQRRLQRLRCRLLPSGSNWGRWGWLEQSGLFAGFWHSSISPQVLLLFFSFKFQWFYVWLPQSSASLLVTFLTSSACWLFRTMTMRRPCTAQHSMATRRWWRSS